MTEPAEVERLVTAHVALARKMARSFARRVPPLWRDEFESAAMLALVDAAQQWEPERSDFGPYLNCKINFCLIDTCRKLFRRSRALPLAEWYDAGYADPRGLDDADAFEAVIRPVSFRQRSLLRAVYRDGLTLAQAGRAMGLSSSYPFHLHRQALDEIREHMRRPA